MSESTSNGKEALRQIVEGLEGVTPGPWYQTGTPWFNDGTGVLAGSPDGNIAFVIADTDDWSMPRDEYEGFPLGDKEADAEHIARCHPDAIRAIAAYVDELRAALESIAANTCCDRCQEAALVARAALKGEA